MSNKTSSADTQFTHYADLEEAIRKAQEEGDSSTIKKMQRRVAVQRERVASDFMRRERPPEPSTKVVAVKTFRLVRSFLRYRLTRAWRRLRGPIGNVEEAQLIRRAIERTGFTGARVGKQLSMRMDLMPLEVCVELAGIDDTKPAMPFELAMQRVRKAARAPLEEAYEVIDPEPIFSDTVQCVYQARVAGGERVAIRVRRNGVRSDVLATVRAVGVIARGSELLGFVRPGFFDSILAELEDFAIEEFDFVRQARQQHVFGERASEAKLSWLTSPDVVHELSSPSVLVSTFKSGVRLSEIVDAHIQGDEAFIRMTEEMGIEVDVVARRLLQATWWSILENLFFVAQPEPHNIVVQPGNKLVFLVFQDCGTLSAPNRRLFGQLMRNLRNDDVSSSAQAIVQMLSPLPYIDIFDFSKRIEAGLWYSLFALKDDHAEWWERTTLSAWETVLEACREEGVAPRM